MIDLIFAATISLVITLLTGPFLINWLRIMKFGQSIRKVGPQSHQKKAGTPTMGGIIIILAVVAATLAMAKISQEVVLALFVLLGYGLVGLLDDSIKIIKKQNEGLTSKQKLLGQIIIAGILAFFVLTRLELGTDILIPYLHKSIDLGKLFIPFVILVLVGASNAVNLTDGLDGLAAGVTIIVTITYAYILYQFGATDLAIFSTAIAGACLGFSWFNSHPAQVFMGDTGSLALGGALAALSVLTKTELFLFIIGGVYVIEATSVMIQVAYFKITRRLYKEGRRVFKMTPIHHHFEKSGWAESKVVVRFWIIAIILSLVGLLGFAKLS
ncbi:phospho-N-acetylmuramoyl-pentapeptide-transferase [Orenia metallireducens]|jgi:phospho-N-acetylmuramoyl-pentapeptide-transferase|uniref:Phospho-N-acetylmuramoyl-pentapeptide-transferase n=1 Tax=Orenia metallireducens TaxID=1413210 RepID=A0A1C0ACN4_9FIRM|nr:phospho-N-acetylmuramoyl-pentapeptide-transferase [Orenia metallireducens]OCL28124.1 phospho-N-acetylmuramoyl-pentapeptide-transferase [Orenia metallireducens]